VTPAGAAVAGRSVAVAGVAAAVPGTRGTVTAGGGRSLGSQRSKEAKKQRKAGWPQVKSDERGAKKGS
jgi:hypothetical protein